MYEYNMKVRYWGVRGSIPVPGPTTRAIGGNTPCIEVVANGETMIFDAGSGIRPLGERMLKGGKPVRATIFFTHVHHDHVQGWPFFTPAFVPTNAFRIYGERKNDMGIEQQLSGIMVPPWFPVPMSIMKANLEFFDAEPGKQAKLAAGLTVTPGRLNHDNGALGYRIESVEKGKKRVYAHITDTNHNSEPDQNAIDLARECDAFSYDSMYTPEEWEKKRDWGHSTWLEATKIAKLAKAKRLILWHHEPTHTDKMMRKILEDARKEFKATYLSYEGLELAF